jgi:ribosomal protein L19
VLHDILSLNVNGIVEKLVRNILLRILDLGRGVLREVKVDEPGIHRVMILRSSKMLRAPTYHHNNC